MDAQTHAAGNDFIDSNFMVVLRDRMLRHDIPSECSQCVKNEAYGKFSQRMVGWQIADRYGIKPGDDPRPVSYEIDMSNVCNLKCRSCNGYRSTKWAADDKALGRRQHGLLDSGWELSNADAKHARAFAFMGGEPFMHQDRMISTLDKCAVAGTLQDCSVSVSTNGTIEMQPELLALLSRVASFSISCSVDGYGRLNDYIRSESTWDAIDANIRRIDDLAMSAKNVSYTIQPTYSIYNYNMLEDLITWVDGLAASPKIDMIYLAWPSHLNAAILPFHARTKVIARYLQLRERFPRHGSLLDGCIAFLSEEFDEQASTDAFAAFNSKLDNMRLTALRDVNPELHSFLRHVTVAVS